MAINERPIEELKLERHVLSRADGIDTVAINERPIEELKLHSRDVEMAHLLAINERPIEELKRFSVI